MSRIGKLPVVFDSKVNVTLGKMNDITIKGAKSSLVIAMRPLVSAKIEDGKILLVRKDDSRDARSLHGLYRSLVYNAVVGVTRGFTKNLELQGVGYRANVAGKKLELALGFSHPISFQIPDGIEIKVEKQTNISVIGADKGLVGEVAAKIRGFRPPEPYLGKGVRYVDEKVRRKAGKSAGK